jgi:urease accessory protein
LLFAVGEPLGRSRREHLLDAVRSSLQSLPQGVQAAATCPNPQLLLVRALAPVVEPMMTTLQGCWAALRQEAWQLKPVPPRIWGV